VESTQEPEIFMPTEAATASGPQGRRLVFFTVPQLDLFIKRVVASRPAEYTYRWAYHPGERMHVLLCEWPMGNAVGLAIPDGVGDSVLQYMAGTTDLFLTTEPVQERLQGNITSDEVQRIILGNTLYLPDVKFTPD